MLSWKFGNKRVSFFFAQFKRRNKKRKLHPDWVFFFRREKAFPKRKRESSKKKYGEQKGKR